MNYRKYYKDYFGIVFNNDYEVHHIDFNRTNNNINNLILLPKRLHQKYHRILNELESCNCKGKFEFDARININANVWNIVELGELVEVIKEIDEWVIFRAECERKRIEG